MDQKVMPHFALLRLIRDARSTKNADRDLLNALALRSQPAKNFISWPSYRQLALDTQLDEITLRRAAKRLETVKLINRVIRANRSNCFFINVPLLEKQAAAVKELEDAAKHQGPDAKSPFGEPVMDYRDAGDGDEESSPWGGSL
jgi:hypothetical protein